MAITVFSIPLILAGLEQVFSGTKHIIILERVRLRIKMLKIAELLKSQVYILKITNRALLSGVFAKSRFINEALKVLKEESDGNKVVKLPLK